MDQNSPVTDVVLDALAEILSAVKPGEYPDPMVARMRLEARIENLKDDVKPYSTYEDGQDARRRIEDKLDALTRAVQALQRAG